MNVPAKHTTSRVGTKVDDVVTMGQLARSSRREEPLDRGPLRLGKCLGRL